MSRPRTYVVTGAASGIGAALAEVLREGGGRVIGVDRTGTEVACDLASEEGRAAMAAGVAAAAPDGVHGVVACAGIVGVTPQVVAINYFGAVATLQRLRPLMVEGEAPRAVAIASIANMDLVDEDLLAACLAGDEASALGRPEDAYANVYATSKLALTRWCRARAVEPAWAGAGVLLNLVAPGVIRTPMSAASFSDPARIAWFDETYPKAMDRWGEAQDIARLAAFLLSPANSYMVGQCIYCDGGVEVRKRGPDALV